MSFRARLALVAAAAVALAVVAASAVVYFVVRGQALLERRRLAAQQHAEQIQHGPAVRASTGRRPQPGVFGGYPQVVRADGDVFQRPRET